MAENMDAGENFESGFARLEEIVKALEGGSVSLEDAVALYKEGVGLVKNCRERLSRARNEIRVYSEGMLVSLDDDGEADGDGE